MSSIIPKNAIFKEVVAVYEVLAYNVYTNSDLNEGRGARIKIGSFADKDDAEIFAAGKGVMGTAADIHVEQMVVFLPLLEPKNIMPIAYDWNAAQVADKLSPFNPVDPVKKRKEILKKLSPEELEFLGLK